MTIKFSAFISFLLAFAFRTHAQLPVDIDLYGTWISEGYAFQGSFYPANDWNKEIIVFHEDYTFEKTVYQIVGHQIDSTVEIGKWNFTQKPKVIRFYSGTERYSADGKILSFEDQLDIQFLSPSYFTFKYFKGKYPVEMRFRKQGATQSFEDNQVAEALKIMNSKISYDTSKSVFYFVNSFKPSKRKTFYFDDDPLTVYISSKNPGTNVEEEKYSMTGVIHDFTDSTVRFKVYSETTETYFSSGAKTEVNNRNDNGHGASGSIVYKEIPKYKLDNVYFDMGNSPVSNTARMVALASGFTTLILAPLISINYKTGNFNQGRYYKTAGIGLIGAGISIPVAIIFKSKPFTMDPASYGKKNHWYLAKERL